MAYPSDEEMNSGETSRSEPSADADRASKHRKLRVTNVQVPKNDRRRHMPQPTADRYGYDRKTDCYVHDPEASDPFDPSSGSLESIEARHGMADWVIEAVGNRPIDHMGRDLLHRLVAP